MRLPPSSQPEVQRAVLNDTSTALKPRAIIHRTRGTTHGPITRLVSPSDLGEHLKPFVFLDFFKVPASGGPRFGMHPHSGIATLSYLIQGETTYEDTTGKKGTLPSGGFEWMRAGKGVWHASVPVANRPGLGFQLWIALPASQESAAAESFYLAPSEIPQAGPARILVGEYGQAQSPIPAPASINYLMVELKEGEKWSYTPPLSHDIAWVAVARGLLNAAGLIDPGELAIFENSNQVIDFVAHTDTVFALGSAAKHPHRLVTGYYSVHTSQDALAKGEAEILRIGQELRDQGRL